MLLEKFQKEAMFLFTYPQDVSANDMLTKFVLKQAPQNNFLHVISVIVRDWGIFLDCISFHLEKKYRKGRGNLMPCET